MLSTFKRKPPTNDITQLNNLFVDLNWLSKITTVIKNTKPTNLASVSLFIEFDSFESAQYYSLYKNQVSIIDIFYSFIGSLCNCSLVLRYLRFHNFNRAYKTST